MQSVGPETEDALVDLIRTVRDTGYRFTTVTPASHARVNARPEAARARHLRDVLGWSRPFSDDAVPSDVLAALQRAGVVDSEGEFRRATIRLSSLDDELFLHSAYPPDSTDAVFFGPDTMRFVSAVIAHLAQREKPVHRAVDIGSGSGAAGIAIAKRAAGAEVLLVDINPAALQAGRINARAAGVAGIEPRRSNLLDDVEGDFDLIVSNPPFMIDRSGRTYRHGGGAFGEGLSQAVVEAAANVWHRGAASFCSPAPSSSMAPIPSATPRWRPVNDMGCARSIASSIRMLTERNSRTRPMPRPIASPWWL